MKFLILFLVLSPLTARANPHWIELSDSQSKQCPESKPCVVLHEKSKKKYPISFSFKKTGNKLNLTTVNIKISKDKIQTFTNLENFQSLYDDEKVNLYAVDLNSDGYLDLALEASQGARLGSFYFYWVYNPKTDNFVQTEEQLEKMHIVKKNLLKSIGSEELYNITPEFKIVAKSPQKNQ